MSIVTRDLLIEQTTRAEKAEAEADRLHRLMSEMAKQQHAEVERLRKSEAEAWDVVDGYRDTVVKQQAEVERLRVKLNEWQGIAARWRCCDAGLKAAPDPCPWHQWGHRLRSSGSAAQNQEAARNALQTILDMGCPLGRDGDLLGAAQRIASEAITELNRAARSSGSAAQPAPLSTEDDEQNAEREWRSSGSAAQNREDGLREALVRIERLMDKWHAPLEHPVGDMSDPAYAGAAAWAAVGSEAHKIATDALARSPQDEDHDGQEGMYGWGAEQRRRSEEARAIMRSPQDEDHKGG